MKPKKILKFISVITILIFLFSYFLENSGYYEYNLQTKKNLTEEQIKQFEKDLQEGKNINIKNYLETNTKDYSNNLTRTTSNTTLKLNKYLKQFLTEGFDIIGKFIK